MLFFYSDIVLLSRIFSTPIKWSGVLLNSTKHTYDFKKMIPMNLIVAVCDNMGIYGTSPDRRLPNDLKNFKKVTSRTDDPEKQNALIFDGETWNTIPEDRRPLEGRLNVVISNTLTEKDVPAGVPIFKTFDNAISYLHSPDISKGIETIWNMGGSEIFKLGLSYPALSRLHTTRIFGSFTCDTSFPEVDWSKFKRVDDPAVVHEENGVRYQFEVYEHV